MTAPPFQPIPLHSSGSLLCLKLDLPGVPWYMYNDHIEGYMISSNVTNNNASCLVLDIAASNSPNSSGILIGCANLPLCNSIPTKVDGEIRGWHIHPRDFVTFRRYSDKPGWSPSEIHRTVVVDAECIRLQAEGGGYELQVIIKSIIGAGHRDLNIPSMGRNKLAAGVGEFKLGIAPDVEKDSGWSIVRAEGVELRDFMPEGAKQGGSIPGESLDKEVSAVDCICM